MYCVINKSFAFPKDETDRAAGYLRIVAAPKPQQIPGWVSKTALFRAAVKDKAILVIESKFQSAAAQPGGDGAPAANGTDDSGETGLGHDASNPLRVNRGRR